MRHAADKADPSCSPAPSRAEPSKWRRDTPVEPPPNQGPTLSHISPACVHHELPELPSPGREPRHSPRRVLFFHGTPVCLHSRLRTHGCPKHAKVVDGGHESPVNGSIGRNAKRLGQRGQASEVTRIGTSASPCPSIPWTEARQAPYQRMGQFFFCVLSFLSFFRVWLDKLLGPRTEKHRCGAKEVVLD